MSVTVSAFLDGIGLHALWLLREGTRTLDEVAAVVGVNPSSVKSWLNWYRHGGLVEVPGHRIGQAGGVVARISLDEQAILAAEAADRAFRSIDDVRQWLQEECGFDYTYWGGAESAGAVADSRESAAPV